MTRSSIQNTKIGVFEVWTDRTPPILMRCGDKIVPLSVEQAQHIIRALNAAIKCLPPVKVAES